MDNYLDRIRDTFPEAIDSYKVIDSGWTNLVIEINDQWIWRFARDRSNPQTALEGAFLPAFSDVSPLPIPTPVWQGEDFIAYKKIKGERCAPEKFFQLGSDQQSDMISGIGAFLTALHSFEFTHLKLSEAPYGGGDFWVDLWPSVEGKLSDRARSNAERFFKNAFNAIDAYPFSKTLIHSDLATNNLLVNFEAPRLTGIIDFGDLSIGDPAADFA
ncbi:MAG: aminoglycoside phosphotransferase family protein, partial [Chloroflexota bacterium]